MTLKITKKDPPYYSVYNDTDTDYKITIQNQTDDSFTESTWSTQDVTYGGPGMFLTIDAGDTATKINSVIAKYYRFLIYQSDVSNGDMPLGGALFQGNFFTSRGSGVPLDEFTNDDDDNDDFDFDFSYDSGSKTVTIKQISKSKSKTKLLWIAIAGGAAVLLILIIIISVIGHHIKMKRGATTS